MLSCKEVTRRIASDEIEGWRDRLSIRIHLTMCRHCRAFAAQIRALGQVARKIGADSDRTESARLEKLQDRILRTLDKAGDCAGDRSDRCADNSDPQTP